jgi:hypothetical protein
MTPNLLQQVKRTVKDGSSAGDSRLEDGNFISAGPVLRSCEITFDRQDRILGIEEAMRTTGILRAARAETQNAISIAFPKDPNEMKAKLANYNRSCDPYNNYSRSEILRVLHAFLVCHVILNV